MNKAASKFAQVTTLNGVKICHRSIGETSKPAVLMITAGGPLAVNAWTASKLAAHKEGLKKLTVPALVMHGRYDPLIPIQAGQALHELIPGARLVEYEGGHNLGNDDTVRGLIEAAIVEHIALHN